MSSEPHQRLMNVHTMMYGIEPQTAQKDLSIRSGNPPPPHLLSASRGTGDGICEGMGDSGFTLPVSFHEALTFTLIFTPSEYSGWPSNRLPSERRADPRFKNSTGNPIM